MLEVSSMKLCREDHYIVSPEIFSDDARDCFYELNSTGIAVYPKRIFTAGDHGTEIPFPVTRYILRRGMGHNNIDYI